VRKWFSARGREDRIEQKELILFPTLEPPPPGQENSVGHWVVVTLNLKKGCFQYIDSLYCPRSNSGWIIYRRMIKTIKKLWLDLTIDIDPPLEPLSTNHYKTAYMDTVKQTDK